MSSLSGAERLELFEQAQYFVHVSGAVAGVGSAAADFNGIGMRRHRGEHVFVGEIVADRQDKFGVIGQ